MQVQKFSPDQTPTYRKNHLSSDNLVVGTEQALVSATDTCYIQQTYLERQLQRLSHQQALLDIQQRNLTQKQLDLDHLQTLLNQDRADLDRLQGEIFRQLADLNEQRALLLQK
jgi:hypothetical protein